MKKAGTKMLEQAIIGAALKEEKVVKSIVETTSPEDFSDRRAAEIVTIMGELSTAGKPITPAGVAMRMGADDDGQAAALSYMTECTGMAEAAGMGYEEAAEAAAKLHGIAVATAAADELKAMVCGGTDPYEAMSVARGKLDAAVNEGAGTTENASAHSIGAILARRMEELTAIRDGRATIGISTGFKSIDAAIRYLLPGNVYVIVGATGMGKSVLGMNIATNVARKTGRRVECFSLEMTEGEVGDRLNCSVGHINLGGIVNASITDEFLQAYGKAAMATAELPITVYDTKALGAITVSKIERICSKVDNLGLIVVDYLQLLSGTGKKENRQLEVAAISRELKLLAGKLSVPIIALCQPNRTLDSRQNKRPMLSDLRESGAIEQDATAVIGLYREGYYDHDCEDPNAAEAIILKSRHGKTGTCDLVWKGEWGLLLDPENA